MELKDIQIGKVVRFICNSCVDECIGVIEKIYYPDMDDPIASVRMRPCTPPDNWPYIDTNVFAPEITNLCEL